MIKGKKRVSQKQVFQILLLMILCIFCTACQNTTQITETSSLSSNHTYVTSFPRLLSCKVKGYYGKVLDLTTPALVNLKNFEKPIAVKCNHAGYWTSNIILEPIHKSRLLDRVTSGEKISLLTSRYAADDLGPQSKLPRALHVALRRKNFRNSDIKNSYYAEELLYAKKNWESIIEDLLLSCEQQSDQISASCRTSMKRIKRFMRQDLMQIEQQRRRSAIE